MNATKVNQIAVIGAGISGLLAAKTLLGEGLSCTVFERSNAVGGVWADGYANFGVQVQKELYQFPDWPLPPDAPDFTPGPVFQKYVEGYCAAFGLTPHIRMNTEVLGLSPRPDGQEGWMLSYQANAKAHQQAFDLVVVCVGAFSDRPFIPSYPGQHEFSGRVMHNSELKTRDRVAGDRVVVVGYGKSATDAAQEAAAVAKQTSLIVRRPHWPVPRKLAGLLPFKWGMLHRMTSALLPPYHKPSALERVLHGVGAPLVWLFWRLTQTLLYFQCRLGGQFGRRTDLVPTVPVEISAFDHATMVVRPEFFSMVRAGTIDAYRGEVSHFDSTGLVLEDGRRVEADTVIFATGWRTDYGFLGDEVLAKLSIEDDGCYLYRHMIEPALNRLVFLGCNAITYEAILTSAIQARWLAELVRGAHVLPDRATMREEIARVKTWKRQWMPANHARGAMLGLHQLHYHDELLRDFGANPKRKRGVFAPLKELLGPYEARDYASIVSGAWRDEEIPLTGP